MEHIGSNTTIHNSNLVYWTAILNFNNLALECGLRIEKGVDKVRLEPLEVPHRQPKTSEQIESSSQNSLEQIREVQMTLTLSDGSHPKLYWFEEVQRPHGLNNSLPWNVNEHWKPANFSRKYLKQLLRDEIHRWRTDGWELVEEKVDNLWQLDHRLQETVLSKLRLLLRLSSKPMWKNTLTIYGALFHVRRVVK